MRLFSIAGRVDSDLRQRMGEAALEEMMWACVNKQGRSRMKKLEAELATKEAVGAVGQ